MRRADRLFQIVQYLRGGRLVTAQTLAERLEVSVRTIYRDIADLMSTGVPIDGEAGIGYVMRSGYYVPPMMFTNSEISALVAGIRMVKAFCGPEIAIAAEEALHKIQDVVPKNIQSQMVDVPYFSMPGDAQIAGLKDRLQFIENAICARRLLVVEYTDFSGEKTRRKLRPMSQVFWGRVWTLVAWCELRGDYRTFRIDRFDLLETGDPFKPDRNISFDRFLRRETCRGPEWVSR